MPRLRSLVRRFARVSVTVTTFMFPTVPVRVIGSTFVTSLIVILMLARLPTLDPSVVLPFRVVRGNENARLIQARAPLIAPDVVA